MEALSLHHAGVGESGPTTTVPACPVSALRPAPWNPRRRFDEEQLVQLAQDIGARGVLQPLVVRATPELPAKNFEIVCGERRWRAAQRAGLEAVPVVVRVLGDREALECAISENGQREELHPLEEADGFLALHTQHGESVEDIASRFGVTPKLVHGRLAIARLCDEARAAFLEGQMSWGVALRIARITDVEHQRETVEALVTKRQPWQGPLTVDDAGRWIAHRFHLRLATAPFDTKSSSLLAGVGACTGCPRNSDSQVTLFDEVTPGECTDPACFARKKEAAWQLLATTFAEGRKVLTAEQSAVEWKGHVAVDELAYEHAGGRKTWRALLGAHLPETLIARFRDGTPVEVITVAQRDAAVKKAGLGKTRVKAKSSPSSSADILAKTEAEMAERKARAVAHLSLVANAYADRKPPIGDRAWWQAVTKAVLLIDPNSLTVVAGHLRLDLGAKGSLFQRLERAMTEEIEARSSSGCRELLVLGLLAPACDGDRVVFSDWLEPLAKLYGLDGAKLTKRAQEQLDAAKKKAPAKKLAPKKGGKR